MITRSTARRVGAVALVLLLAGCTSDESEPLTVKVTRTSVTSSVTATGTLQGITEQNLGFPEAGKLVELNVAVGQQVEPGQVLARLDDFGPRQDLEAARAELAQEQAVLARIRGGNQVDAAEDDVKRAGEVLEATKEQADAVDDANASAVEQAERQLKLDEEVLDDTEDRTRADRRSCTTADRRDAEEDAEEDEPRGLVFSRSAESRQSSDCERAGQKEAEVEAARRQVRASKAALEQAENQRRVENAQQDLAIENARRDLATAKNEAEAARIKVNQQVEVTFDAVPDLERTGTVVGIAPTGTDIQGVTSYYATIVLNELDPRLMDGQTASAHVIVDQLDNTLVVPNAAIQQSGQTGIVTVLEANGATRQVQVELGLAGDSVTQVVAGLREGQQVVVAQEE
jgi:multidrug efflux pump subunit AcrA (membrane-fusion protein)